MCGSFFKNFSLCGYGPKDPWPRVLSLPGRFVGDPASLAHDNMLRLITKINMFRIYRACDGCS